MNEKLVGMTEYSVPIQDPVVVDDTQEEYNKPYWIGKSITSVLYMLETYDVPPAMREYGYDFGKMHIEACRSIGGDIIGAVFNALQVYTDTEDTDTYGVDEELMNLDMIDFDYFNNSIERIGVLVSTYAGRDASSLSREEFISTVQEMLKYEKPESVTDTKVTFRRSMVELLAEITASHQEHRIVAKSIPSYVPSVAKFFE